MLRTIECKLYLKPIQVTRLESWLSACCWIYNRALEQRIKAYQRRGQQVTLYEQQRLLTKWRERMPHVGAVPLAMSRDALRRVDRGMQAFFRRIKAGEKPGFPRFRAHDRYSSLESLADAKYVRTEHSVYLPKIGRVKCRGIGSRLAGVQKVLRIIKRASGWYCQVVIETESAVLAIADGDTSVGIDVGLSSFATLSDGTAIANPRWLKKAAGGLRRGQKSVARCKTGSQNRRKAVKRLQREYEKLAARRLDFAHQQSRRLVNRYELIAVENLAISNMAKGRLAKSILDAAWGQFINQLTYKAAYAGRRVIAVNPRGTSQTCPDCGNVKKKELWERLHNCSCGLVCDRDHAAARVILSRALGAAGVVEGLVNVSDRVVASKPTRRSKHS